MRAASRHPVGRLVMGLVVSIQINQLLLRHGASPSLLCDALRILNLDAPQMALQGDTIRLTCSFSLTNGPFRSPRQAPTMDKASPGLSAASEPLIETKGKQLTNTSLADTKLANLDGHHFKARKRRHSLFERSTRSTQRRKARSLKDDGGDPPQETLYAIKWYKDDREFYQFVSKDWPHKRALPMSGLNVDVDKSDNQTVVLKSVSLKTSGLFRCEVSTDAPSFETRSIEQKIFIYSLPVEGPVIETSLTRTKSSQLSLYLGDQLEFRCSSRESKPSTKLDWIINETWNLTARNPTDASGLSAFNVTNRRFVRAPTISMNFEVASPPTTIMTAAAKNHAVLVPDSQRFKQPLNSESVYELIDAKGHPIVRPVVEGSHHQSGANLSISAESLDHLAESSMSILSFSVNSNLFHYLQMYAAQESNTHKSGMPTQKSFTDGALANAANRTSPRTSFKTKKLFSADRRATLNSNGQQRSDGKIPLDIRCVARVLHLTMMDEVKLRVLNRTRLNSVETSTQRLEKRIQSSSAATHDAIITIWLHISPLLPWIATQRLEFIAPH